MIDLLPLDVAPTTAYIDPGIGILVIQFLLASIATGLLFFSGLRRRIWDFLRRNKRNK